MRPEEEQGTAQREASERERIVILTRLRVIFRTQAWGSQAPQFRAARLLRTGQADRDSTVDVLQAPHIGGFAQDRRRTDTASAAGVEPLPSSRKGRLTRSRHALRSPGEVSGTLVSTLQATGTAARISIASWSPPEEPETGPPGHSSGAMEGCSEGLQWRGE